MDEPRCKVCGGTELEPDPAGYYRKAGRRPLRPFRGGDECRTLSD
jgi:hypothetical protein